MRLDENAMKNKYVYKEYYRFDRNKMEVIEQIDSLFTAFMSFTNCLPPDNDTWMSFTKCDTKNEVTSMFLVYWLLWVFYYTF